MNLIDSLSVFALLLLASLALLRKYIRVDRLNRLGKQKNGKHPACACGPLCLSTKALSSRTHKKVDG